MALFVIKSKKHGPVKVRVDDEDAHLLRSMVWTISCSQHGALGVAHCATERGKAKTTTLGHAIVKCDEKAIVIRRNREGEVLDFRKANLAVCKTRADAAMYQRDPCGTAPTQEAT